MASPKRASPCCVLPSTTSSLLHSTLRIPCYESVASELIQNAVEGQASNIRIAAHAASLRLLVADDGLGISEEDMKHVGVRGWGSEGEGKRGEALAALGEVGSIEITARRRGQNSWTKWIREGVVLGFEKARDDSKIGRSGTRVEVWELFARTPVRRRVELERGEQLVRAVEEIVGTWACARPEIGFVLEKDNDVVVIASEAKRGGLMKERLEVIYGKSVVQRLSPLGTSGITYHGLRVSGFVSSIGVSPSLSLQVLSWNQMPVVSGSDLHKIVIRAWKKAFPVHEVQSRRTPAFVLNFHSSPNWASVTRDYKGVSLQFCDCRVVGGLLLKVFANNRENRPSESFCETQTSGVGEKRAHVFKHSRLSLPVVKYTQKPTTSNFKDSFLKKRSLRKTTIQFLVHRRSLSAEPIRESKAPLRSPSEVVRPKSAAIVRNAFRKALPAWTNPCFENQGRNLQKSRSFSGLLEACPFDSEPALGQKMVKVSRDMIPRTRIIGQADAKFIIARVDNTLVAFDQHAISERFLFEQFQKQILDSTSNPKVFSVPHPIPLPVVDLSSTDASTLKDKYEVISRWGWRLKEVSPTSYLIEGVPHLLGLTITGIGPLHEFLTQLRRSVGISEGRIPKAIRDAIAAGACHNAVRFGDQLNRCECKKLVDRLSSCELPFQCAHGRPSLVPLVVLDG